MDLLTIQTHLSTLLVQLLEWLTSPKFYAQCGLIFVAMLLAYSLSRWLVKHSPLLRQVPEQGSVFGLKSKLYQARALVTPLLSVLALAISIEVSIAIVQQAWLIRIAQGIAVLMMCYSLISLLVVSPFLKVFFKWTILPIAILHVFGWLAPAIQYLDGVSINLGNIEFSVYGILRTLFFGLILFWFLSVNVKRLILARVKYLLSYLKYFYWSLSFLSCYKLWVLI